MDVKFTQNIYIIEESCANQDTGAYFPQISKMKPKYNFNGVHSINVVNKCVNKIPDFIPDFDYFILNGKSKKSNIISSSVMSKIGFIIDDITKGLLEKFKLPEHVFFPITIQYRNDFIYNYYWFHIVCDLSDYVDFKASIFEIQDISRKPINQIRIESKEHLFIERERLKQEMKANNTYYTIWAKSIRIIKSIDYDLFCIRGTFDNNFYINANLKNSLIEHNITGLSIYETQRIIF